MPFTLVVLGVAVVASLVRGGRLRRVADAHLAGTWLLFVGVLLQVGVQVAAARGHLEGTDGYVFLLASQLLVLAWVWRNRYRPGMVLIGLGLALNAVVIGLNGAMPVDPKAIEAIGLSGAEPPPGKHILMTDATRLGWLGDRLPLPPLHTVISVGDIVLAAGLIPLVHHLMTFRPAHERRGGLRGSGYALLDGPREGTPTSS